ncbi:MAG: lipid-A-disaccharide synthase [Leptolyngbyaceae cyanobacterium SL_7_1]|nr:lipid-A-disaccharide synthase [Leptolyngbyaceae cyanobacterium SL_7_1]
MNLHLFISTGEVSGDLQGAMLVEALWRQAERRGIELRISALGGDRMAAAGATLLGNTTGIGSIGIFESLPYVLPTLRMQGRVHRFLNQHPPDGVVMVDYLGPNLGIGHLIRQRFPQVFTVYYIAPQEWVWSLSSRNTRRIVRMTDRLLAIFPAEAEYYHRWGAAVTYVGHPLVDRMQSAPQRAHARQALGIDPATLAVALLPASRRQELTHVLPVMLQAAHQLQAKIPQVHFWLPLSSDRFRPVLTQAIQAHQLRATIVAGQTQEVLAAADLAIAKSGTVNLELALLNVPQVVMYRVSRLTAWIAEYILKFSILYMSPPNLALMEPIVPEFLQYHATPENLLRESMELLLNRDRRQQMIADYQRLRQTLGEPGVCDRAAAEILERVVGQIKHKANR